MEKLNNDCIINIVFHINDIDFKLNFTQCNKEYLLLFKKLINDLHIIKLFNNKFSHKNTQIIHQQGLIMTSLQLINKCTTNNKGL